jgi:Zn-dependent protease with chaperone function
MSADLLPAGVLALSWGVVYLIHSTVLLGGAWLFLKLRRRAGHGLRETVWKTALVGSLVTASLQMLPAPHGPFGAVTISLADFRAPTAPPPSVSVDSAAAAGNLNTSLPAPFGRAHQDVTAEAGEIVWIAADDHVDNLPARRAESAVSGPWSEASPRGGAAAQIGPLSAGTMLMTAVASALAAVALGIARCLGQTWVLKRKLVHCMVVESGPARRLLDELCRLAPRAPEVRLLSAPDDPEPAAFGIRRWTIVLPARAVCDLSEDELRALLAHELAHLVRGDSLWLLVSRFVCSCLAFQPLNHVARREWQRAAEYMCDIWAVSRTGAPLALARCLAEVAGWRLSGQASAALLAATGRKSGLSDRIERLLQAADLTETWVELRQRRYVLLVAGVLLALVTWCAPRLQFAVAATDAGEIRKIGLGQEESTAQQQTASDEGPENGAAAAKPPASGESGAVVENGLGAPEAETRSLDVGHGQDAPANDLYTLLRSLDRDLNELERELRELESLLAKEDAAPAVSRLANRLRQEIVHLKQRRRVLNAKWKGLSSSPFTQQ